MIQFSNILASIFVDIFVIFEYFIYILKYWWQFCNILIEYDTICQYLASIFVNIFVIFEHFIYMLKYWWKFSNILVGILMNIGNSTRFWWEYNIILASIFVDIFVILKYFVYIIYILMNISVRILVNMIQFSNILIGI